MISSRLPSDANAHAAENTLGRAPGSGATMHEGPPSEAQGGPEELGCGSPTASSVSVNADAGRAMQALEALLADLKSALDAGDLDEARHVAKRLGELFARRPQG